MQTAPEDAETRRGLKRSAELPIDDSRSEVRGRADRHAYCTADWATSGCGRSSHEHGQNGTDLRCSCENDERSSEM